MRRISFTVKPSYKAKIEDIHGRLQEINRGTGSPRPKKGKGSYSRRRKHAKRYV